MDRFTQQLRTLYEEKKTEIKTHLDVSKQYRYAFKDDLIRLTHDERTVLEGRCLTLGVYDRDINSWFWAWGIPFFHRDGYDKKKIDEFRDYLDKKEGDGKISSYDYEKYRFYCDNTSFAATKENIKEIVAMCLKAYDGVWVFEVPMPKTSAMRLVVLTSINRV